MTVSRSLFASLLTLAAFSAHANAVTETTDAGDLLPSAFMLPSGTTSIAGSISASDTVDLFGFDVGSGTVEFTFKLTSSEWFDSDITLFNADGNPIYVTDYENFSYNFSSGRYYIAISDWNIAATDGSGHMIADDYYGVLNQSGVLGGWDITSSPFRYGPYGLAFSTPTVPEPDQLLLSVAGLLTALVMLKKRKVAA